MEHPVFIVQAGDIHHHTDAVQRLFSDRRSDVSTPLVNMDQLVPAVPDPESIIEDIVLMRFIRGFLEELFIGGKYLFVIYLKIIFMIDVHQQV